MANTRCPAARPSDQTSCEGLPDAVLLRDRKGGERIGCVHHAAVLAAAIPCTVFPGPSAYVGYAWGDDAAREALARAIA